MTTRIKKKSQEDREERRFSWGNESSVLNMLTLRLWGCYQTQISYRQDGGSAEHV